MDSRVPTLIIIGGVAGGASAAAKARRMNEAAKIIIFEKGPYVSFANCGLPYYVKNAIPETRPGGCVTVSGHHGTRMDTVELAVADTGRGMPPEVRDRLFTAQAYSTRQGGTGLGTKIVKDVVDLHHGQITVESEVGHGPTFRLMLPLSQDAALRTPSRNG